MSAVIETENLTKVYEGALKGQDVHALKAVSFTINRGEIFAYLGPNGSGKTTTIKLLLGLIFPTQGKLRVLGKTDVHSAAVKKNIGYLPEGAYYPEFLEGEEVLRFYGQLYGMGGRELERRISEVLDTVGLSHARKRLLRGYSKGMRQRIGLAQALLSDPQILILDEPTTGLDPIARKEIRDILVDLRNRGKTLFISSHELLEVEMISDRVGILFEGELKTLGTIDELLTDRDVTLEIEETTPEKLERFHSAGVKVEDTVEKKLILRVPSEMSVFTILDMCREMNIKLISVRPRRETLEELFVRVVGAAGKAKENVQ